MRWPATDASFRSARPCRSGSVRDHDGTIRRPRASWCILVSKKGMVKGTEGIRPGLEKVERHASHAASTRGMRGSVVERARNTETVRCAVFSR